MGRLLQQTDITSENQNFWWFHLTSIRGYDEEKELNLDEALAEVIHIPQQLPDFTEWYQAFCPEGEMDQAGMLEQPNVLAGNLTKDLSFAIEFHVWETTYFLNDCYIGNTGGEFEAWFLTWEELKYFGWWTFLFLLFLPMVGLEERQRLEAEEFVATYLREIPIFSVCADYAAKCMVNGLIMQGALAGTAGTFSVLDDVGIVNNQNHSVRNILQYPRYIEDVKIINQVLQKLVAQK